MNRLQIYRLLTSLMNRGLIKVSMDRPRRYIPIGLEETLEILEEGARSRYLELEKKKFLLMDEWIKIPDFQLKEEIFSFRLIQGNGNVTKCMNTLLESAEKDLQLILKGDTLTNSVIQGVDDILEKCDKNSVRLRCISEIDFLNVKAARRFLQFSDLRHSPSRDLAQVIIVDGRELLVGLSGDLENPSYGQQSAIWTNHPEFAMTMNRFFDILWEKSQDGKAVLASF
jgi:sugar-specific transcriptional regulator TrmB